MTTEMATQATMILWVESDDQGTKAFPVSSVQEASTTYRAFVRANCYGASEVSRGKVVGAEKPWPPVAIISYNGTINLP